MAKKTLLDQEAVKAPEAGRNGNYGAADQYGNVAIWHLTPDKALKILDDNNYGDQRPIRQKKVNMYIAEMEAGRFEVLTDITFVSLPDGTLIMTNGYHRLFALASIQDPEFMLPFTVTTVYKEDMRGVAENYGRQDIGLNRNYTDTFGAFGIYDKTNLSKDALNRSVSGVRHVLNHFSSRHMQLVPELMMDHLVEWLPVAEQYFSAISGGEQEIVKRLKRAPVIGIGFLAFKHEPGKARQFWHGAAYDDGLRRGDPRKTLGTWLLSTIQSGGRSHGGTVVNSKDLAKYTARAWEHWFNGTEVRILRLSRKAGVITRVAGTGYEFE